MACNLWLNFKPAQVCLERLESAGSEDFSCAYYACVCAWNGKEILRYDTRHLGFFVLALAGMANICGIVRGAEGCVNALLRDLCEVLLSSG